VYGKADHQERILNLYSSHSCRHSGITDFYLKTKDIILTQKYARHRSIKSTMQYIHTTEEQLKEAIQSSVLKHDPEEFKEFLVVYEEFKKRKNVGVPPYSCFQSTV
jgi:integrase